MVKYIKGDILNVTEGIVVQQVNCKGVMGAGLAKQIRDKLKADNKMYEETLYGLSYCTVPELEKSIYENMINMNEKIITQCSEWLVKLEQV